VIPRGLRFKEYKKLSCFATFGFFLFSKRLQKQAFDALENKKSQPKG
jgi:hypothetical protein